jgi:acyl carrier protein
MNKTLSKTHIKANTMGDAPDAPQEIKTTLRDFITETFLPSSGLDAFADTDSFMEKGIIDSTGVLELLEFIEETFSIQVEDEEVIPDYLDSLTRLAAFIQWKKADAGQ